jgi:D-alanyl-lipoteichoic acid acyltransferase DltB (MBOAT superfamily)
MIGLVFVLHFGLFHIMSICWRLRGISAEPMMNFPILASSLNDFWGKRWNLAFRDLAFTFILRPLVGRIGVIGATMAVFLFSGLVHDLVISLPVNDGWGGPTIYFAAQGVGMLLERSDLGRRLGLGNGFIGRLFCGVITVCPVGMLFHQPFVLEAILPTLAAIGIA